MPRDNNRMAIFKFALRQTIPVLPGMLFLGMAFGLLMLSKGMGGGWPALMSAAIYAGSMQFVTVSLLAGAFDPLYALLLTLVVNARHLFYGVSMLERYSGTGKMKPYLVFGLTDETFSIICSSPELENGGDRWFMLFVTMLHQIYWVTGTLIGSAAGTLVKFNAKGIDFVMTALFVVIFINQWRSQTKHEPSLIGVAASVVCLILFGPSGFIIPAMISMTVLLCLLKKRIERGRTG